MVELRFSQVFLYAVGVMQICLILGGWWLLRLHKRTHALEGVVLEADRVRRELLAKNDSLTIEIEKREQLERELRGSEERYRTYIEHAPMGIFVAYDNGGFALVNPAISLMTGFSKNELSMMTLADFFSSDTAQESAHFLKAFINRSLVKKKSHLKRKMALSFFRIYVPLRYPATLSSVFAWTSPRKKEMKSKFIILRFLMR